MNWSPRISPFWRGVQQRLRGGTCWCGVRLAAAAIVLPVLVTLLVSVPARAHQFVEPDCTGIPVARNLKATLLEEQGCVRVTWDEPPTSYTIAARILYVSKTPVLGDDRITINVPQGVNSYDDREWGLGDQQHYYWIQLLRWSCNYSCTCRYYSYYGGCGCTPYLSGPIVGPVSGHLDCPDLPPVAGARVEAAPYPYTVRLTWEPMPAAYGFIISEIADRATSDSFTAATRTILVPQGASSYTIDHSAAPPSRREYFYWIRPYSKCGPPIEPIGPILAVSDHTRPLPPTSIRVSKGTTPCGICVSWDSPGNTPAGVQFRLYREPVDGSDSATSQTISGTTTNIPESTGREFRFWVTTLASGDESDPSPIDTGWAICEDSTHPQVVASADPADSTAIRLSWQPVSGASGYRILGSADAVSSPTVVLATIPPTAFEYADPLYDVIATAGERLYRVEAQFPCNAASQSETIRGRCSSPAPPPPSNARASQGTLFNSILYSWERPKGAGDRTVLYNLYWGNPDYPPDNRFYFLRNSADTQWTANYLPDAGGCYPNGPASLYVSAVYVGMDYETSGTLMTGYLRPRNVVAPTNLSATREQSTILLTWKNASEVADGYSLRQEIYIGSTPERPVEPLPASIDHDGYWAPTNYRSTLAVPAGEEKYIWVCTVDSCAGTRLFTGPVGGRAMCIPPELPTDFAATQGTLPGKIRLTWSPPASISSEAASEFTYSLYRSDTPTTASALLMNSRLGLGTTNVELTFGDSTHRYFWIRVQSSAAACGSPISEWSPAAEGWADCSPPGPVTGLFAPDGSREIRIPVSWDPVPGAKSYAVWSAAAPEFGLLPTESAYTLANSAIDPISPEIGQFRYFQVVPFANCAIGGPVGPESGYTIAAAPEPPEDIVTTARCGKTCSITASWSTPHGADEFVAFRADPALPFHKYRPGGPEEDPEPILTYQYYNQNTSPRTFYTSLFTQGFRYTSEYAARWIAGRSSIDGSISEPVLVRANWGAPYCLDEVTPANLVATRGTLDDSILLTWDPTPGSGIFTYHGVFERTSSTGARKYIEFRAVTPHYVDTEVEAGVRYSYSLTLERTCGFGPASAPAIGFAGAACTTSPDATPADVRASLDTSESRITVSWDPVPGADGYVVYRQLGYTPFTWPASEAMYVPSDPILDVAADVVSPSGIHPANRLSWDDIDSTPGVAAVYRVAARSDCAVGFMSDSVTGRRAVCPPPAAPANLVVARGRADWPTHLSWDAADGAVGYHLYRASSPVVLPKRSYSVIPVRALSFDDSYDPDKEVYYYWVQSVNECGARSEPVGPISGFTNLTPTPTASPTPSPSPTELPEVREQRTRGGVLGDTAGGAGATQADDVNGDGVLDVGDLSWLLTGAGRRR